MKSRKFYMILLLEIIFLLPGSTCFSQSIVLPSIYVGANRMSLDSQYKILDPGWGGQLGFNIKSGAKWIQFDGGLEFNVTNLKKKYDQSMTSDTGRKLESKSSISSYAIHTTIPVGISLGYYVSEWNHTNIEGGSIVGGGFVDIGIWGQNRIKQDNRLSSQRSTLFEESNVYTQNCFGNSSIQRKRFDAGIYLGIAVTTSLIGINVIYRKGFLNMSNIDGYNYTNNGLFINLTFNCTYDD